MRSTLLKILTVSALCVAVSSCGSRVETRLAFPPAADLKVTAEPAYPEAALAAGAEGEQAERKWWNNVLTWGRAHHDRLARVCTWARDLKMQLPPGYCGR